MKVLILGMGYVGTELADRLAKAGHSVVGVRRSDPGDTKHHSRISTIHGDLTASDFWTKLPTDADCVVHCASSSRGGIDGYRAIFGTGTDRLCDWLRRHPPRRFVFTSSTSVYAQTHGDIVTESSTAAGAGETGQILRRAEEAFRASLPGNSQASILRVAGIYGPERGHLFLKFLADEATITGDRNRWLNQVHRDDVVGAIRQVLNRPTVPAVINVADNEPVRQQAFFAWLAERLGKAMPPAGEAAKKRKRALTDKRVENGRLRGELDYQLKYPTFREGYLAEMGRLGLTVNQSGN
jgi:nucleoside-diphosphate-sugar epimerase